MGGYPPPLWGGYINPFPCSVLFCSRSWRLLWMMTVARVHFPQVVALLPRKLLPRPVVQSYTKTICWYGSLSLYNRFELPEADVSGLQVLFIGLRHRPSIGPRTVHQSRDVVCTFLSCPALSLGRLLARLITFLYRHHPDGDSVAKWVVFSSVRLCVCLCV